MSFTRQNGNRLRIFGIPSFTGSIAEDAGLTRPQSQQFDDTSRDISEEELNVADADWIFYGVQGRGPGDVDERSVVGAVTWCGRQPRRRC